MKYKVELAGDRPDKAVARMANEVLEDADATLLVETGPNGWPVLTVKTADEGCQKAVERLLRLWGFAEEDWS